MKQDNLTPCQWGLLAGGIIPRSLDVIVKKLSYFFKNSDERFKNFWGKRGGFFCLMDKKTGEILLLCLIGQVPFEKIERYRSLAQEKATRLFSHLTEGHLTSYESRDPVNDKWGGAIVGDKYIHSFSGFPEDGDSFIVSMSAYRMQDISKRRMRFIIRISKIVGLARNLEM